MATSGEAQRYGIGAVARMTGLKDHTIRVWERRYGAVVAERAANGRRLYSSADVEKLALLKRLTDRGLSIGSIANLSIDELAAQAEEIREISARPVPDTIRVALLGEMLAGRLLASARDLSPLDIVASDTDEQRFAADLDGYTVDAIVVESAVLDGDTADRFHACLERAGTASGVLVFHFGRSRDIERLADAGIVAIRAPLTEDELVAAVVRSCTSTAARRPATKSKPAGDDGEWQFGDDIAARKFSQRQLANLAASTSSVDCECPKHLAELVSDLGAFEAYSARCANRDSDDAALHRYLHRSTAEARALIESALKRVVDADGLTY